VRIAIAGAGGFGREVLVYARDAYPADCECVFLDDDQAKIGAVIDGAPVVGTTIDWQQRADDQVVIALGNVEARMRVRSALADRGVRFGTVVHPRAYVSTSARIEEGCVLAPFAFVGPASRLGSHTALNIFSSVGHDGRTGMCCVLSPYATLNGNACLEDGVFLGTQATVGVGVRVGNRSRVAAGSVVYHDVGVDSLAAGNPARARAIYSKTPPG
jgi:sugar O-acyltransferase (sialic acid O-acetyltransferase NeuD family)